MNYSELKEKIDQFVATVPDQYGNTPIQDRAIAESVLRGFLWWLYPQTKPKDLPCYDEITDFTESQFRFLLARNRTTKIEAELYGIQHPERCQQPEEEV